MWSTVKSSSAHCQQNKNKVLSAKVHRYTYTGTAHPALTGGACETGSMESRDVQLTHTHSLTPEVTANYNPRHFPLTDHWQQQLPRVLLVVESFSLSLTFGTDASSFTCLLFVCVNNLFTTTTGAQLFLFHPLTHYPATY